MAAQLSTLKCVNADARDKMDATPQSVTANPQDASVNDCSGNIAFAAVDKEDADEDKEEDADTAVDVVGGDVTAKAEVTAASAKAMRPESVKREQNVRSNDCNVRL